MRLAAPITPKVHHINVVDPDGALRIEKIRRLIIGEQSKSGYLVIDLSRRFGADFFGDTDRVDLGADTSRASAFIDTQNLKNFILQRSDTKLPLDGESQPLFNQRVDLLTTAISEVSFELVDDDDSIAAGDHQALLRLQNLVGIAQQWLYPLLSMDVRDKVLSYLEAINFGGPTGEIHHSRTAVDQHNMVANRLEAAWAKATGIIYEATRYDSEPLIRATLNFHDRLCLLPSGTLEDRKLQVKSALETVGQIAKERIVAGGATKLRPFTIVLDDCDEYLGYDFGDLPQVASSSGVRLIYSSSKELPASITHAFVAA